MFVDVSNLINDSNVKRKLKIYLKNKQAEPDEFGVVLPPEQYEPDYVIDNVGFVEQRDRAWAFERGTYIDRITYDFYFPRNKVLGIDLIGAIVVDMEGNRFRLTECYLNWNYASHTIYNGTKEFIDMEGDIRR